MAIFVVYQALPKKLAESRNDKLIFEEIGYLFSINMICNALWLVIYMINTPLTFAIAQFLIIGILASGLKIYMKANSTVVLFIGMLG